VAQLIPGAIPLNPAVVGGGGDQGLRATSGEAKGAFRDAKPTILEGLLRAKP